jgi:hypothetical protein
VVFEENHRFSPLFLAVVTALMLGVGAFFAVRVPSQEKIAALLAVLAPILVVGIIYFAVQLRTRVKDEALQVGLWPFGGTTISLQEIDSVEIVDYRPLRDFGGWGVRYGSKGKIYSAQGSKAVKVSGRKLEPIFIGSQRPQELAAALEFRGHYT